MIEQNARRTKVVKSFEGGALGAAEAKQVTSEEVDVLRLVYHTRHAASIAEFIRAIKDQPKGKSRQPIMLDVSSWVQASVTGLKDPKEVAFGERIVMSQVGGPGPYFLKTETWDRLFVVDAKVFIGSGNVALRTVSVNKDRVELEVTQGGTIYSDMDVTIPETRKDPERRIISADELAPLVREGIDYLIIPGQWKPGKITAMRQTFAATFGDRAPWLIAKVDSGDVYERLPEILPVVEGVLISRREMALTLNPVTVPMITKEIIQLCNDQAKVVLTASEMLASMRRNITPTRAEVSDVANAVLDGTDAVVLSEEVANGRHGAKAVGVMHRIIMDIEERNNVSQNWVKHAPRIENEMDAIAYHALKTAERIKAKAIVTITKAGNTALKLASFRAPIPIIAVTFSEAVRNRLSLVRGVDTLQLDANPNLDEVLPLVNDQLVRGSWLKAGDPIIFVAITLSPVGRESSNLFTIQILN